MSDKLTYNEIESIDRYLKGEQWSCSTFIDEDTIVCGYGSLNLEFEFELPLWFRIEKNILGCRTWSEFKRKKLREKKLKRIMK